MSLAVEFAPFVSSRLRARVGGQEDNRPEVSEQSLLAVYVTVLLFELLGLNYRSANSPYRLNLPELNFSSEAELVPRLPENMAEALRPAFASDMRATLNLMRPMLAQAIEIVEKVKARIKHDEEQIRVRTSKALLLRTHLMASVFAFEQEGLEAEIAPVENDDFTQGFEAWAQAQRTS